MGTFWNEMRTRPKIFILQVKMFITCHQFMEFPASGTSYYIYIQLANHFNL